MRRLGWGLTAVALGLSFGLSSAFAETPPLFAGTGSAESSYADPLPATVAVSSYVPPACAAKPCPLLIAIHGMGRNARGARDAWKVAATEAVSSFSPHASTRTSFRAAASSRAGCAASRTRPDGLSG
ncbi:hypothetical protein ACWIEX_05800 [Bosea sp. NPDC055353]